MHSGSKLDISKSSLLSLKAEIARKNEEVAKARAQAQSNHIKPIVKHSKSSIFSRANLGIDKRQLNDVSNLTPDEESKIQRSRSALEEKAKIYDSLSQQSTLESNSEYLVNFAKKSSEARCIDPHRATSDSYDDDEEEERRRRDKEEEEEEARIADSDEYDAPSDPEDDWVDFTDSLGRTRRCLRRDLSRFRELDDRLLKSLEAKAPVENRESPPPGPLPPGGLPAGCAAPDLFSDDMRREQQRLKWEEQEEKLRDKADIHYQDVLFDEARTHGVAYFPFARDEGARRAQQDDLLKLRRETESRQKAALTQREKRQQLLRNRLRAAHNRKRAREGLPPLGEDEELPGEKAAAEATEEAAQPPEPAITIQRAKGPKPRPSPAVRPWDIGKEGVRVMTQDEWNDRQREERKKEFAPPSFYEDREGSRRTERRPERRDEHRRKRRAADDDIPEPRTPESPPPGPAAPESPPPGPLPPDAVPWPPPVHLPPPSLSAPWPPQPVPPPNVPPILDMPAMSGGLYFTTKKPKRPEVEVFAEGEPPPPGEEPPPPRPVSLYFTSKKAKKQEVRLRMEEVEDFTEEPPPAPRPGGLYSTSKKAKKQEVRLRMEEVEDFTEEPPPPGEEPPPPRPRAGKGGSATGRVGAEIAPPPTIEYFGPSVSATDRSRAAGRSGSSRTADDLSSSISAGLRFLREQAEEKERKRTDKGWADFV